MQKGSSKLNTETRLVGEKVSKTKKEIEELKAQLQKLINDGLQKPQSSVPVTTRDAPIVKESQTCITKSSPNKQQLPETPKKTCTYNKEAAREYIKKQREKRKEELKDKRTKIDLTQDLKKQRLQELRQKSLQILSKSIRKKREPVVSCAILLPAASPTKSNIIHKNITVRDVPSIDDLPKQSHLALKNITVRSSEFSAAPSPFKKKSSYVPPPPVLTKAAIKIQSAFRGYRQRKLYQLLLKKRSVSKQVQTNNPVWLISPRAPYPYNFISALKRKLNLANQHNQPETIDASVQAENVSYNKQIDLKSFLSHKCLSPDNSFQNVNNNDSDTSKNIPDISSESCGSNKRALSSEDLKVKLDKFKRVKLLVEKSHSDLKPPNVNLLERLQSPPPLLVDVEKTKKDNELNCSKSASLLVEQCSVSSVNSGLKSNKFINNLPEKSAEAKSEYSSHFNSDNSVKFEEVSRVAVKDSKSKIGVQGLQLSLQQSTATLENKSEHLLESSEYSTHFDSNSNNSSRKHSDFVFHEQMSNYLESAPKSNRLSSGSDTFQPTLLSLKAPSVCLKSSSDSDSVFSVNISNRNKEAVRSTTDESSHNSKDVNVNEKALSYNVDGNVDDHDDADAVQLVLKPGKRTVVTNKVKSNEIHLKFEAELHLLNEFNESLQQVMAIEKSLVELHNNPTSKTSFQTRDTQTSIVTSKTSSNNSQVPTINYTRGSGDLIDETNTSFIMSSGLEISQQINQSIDSAKENNETIAPYLKEKCKSMNTQAGFSLEMFERLIQDEDARIENLKAILKIREKALVDRTRGELAWLEVQKRHLRDSGQLQEISVIKKKQRGLLIKLEHERHEMQRLKQMQKAASRERKLVLKEERNNMIKCQLSTSNMSTKIKRATKEYKRASGPLKVYNIRSCSESIMSETSVSIQSSVHDEINSVVSRSQSVVSHIVEAVSTHVNSMDEEKITMLVADKLPIETECVKKSLLMREAVLQKRRKAAEELLQWHQRLLEEEEKITQLELAAIAVINQIPTASNNSKHKFKGAQLNLLWHNMTGRNENKFKDNVVYSMSKTALQQFCKDAKKCAIGSNKMGLDEYSSDFDVASKQEYIEFENVEDTTIDEDLSESENHKISKKPDVDDESSIMTIEKYKELNKKISHRNKSPKVKSNNKSDTNILTTGIDGTNEESKSKTGEKSGVEISLDSDSAPSENSLQGAPKTDIYTEINRQEYTITGDGSNRSHIINKMSEESDIETAESLTPQLSDVINTSSFVKSKTSDNSSTIITNTDKSATVNKLSEIEEKIMPKKSNASVNDTKQQTDRNNCSNNNDSLKVKQIPWSIKTSCKTQNSHMLDKLKVEGLPNSNETSIISQITSIKTDSNSKNEMSKIDDSVRRKEKNYSNNNDEGQLFDPASKIGKIIKSNGIISSSNHAKTSTTNNSYSSIQTNDSECETIDQISKAGIDSPGNELKGKTNNEGFSSIETNKGNKSRTLDKTSNESDYDSSFIGVESGTSKEVKTYSDLDETSKGSNVILSTGSNSEVKSVLSENSVEESGDQQIVEVVSTINEITRSYTNSNKKMKCGSISIKSDIKKSKSDEDLAVISFTNNNDIVLNKNSQLNSSSIKTNESSKCETFEEVANENRSSISSINNNDEVESIVSETRTKKLDKKSKSKGIISTKNDTNDKLKSHISEDIYSSIIESEIGKCKTVEDVLNENIDTASFVDSIDEIKSITEIIQGNKTESVDKAAENEALVNSSKGTDVISLIGTNPNIDNSYSSIKTNENDSQNETDHVSDGNSVSLADINVKTSDSNQTKILDATSENNESIISDMDVDGNVISNVDGNKKQKSETSSIKTNEYDRSQSINIPFEDKKSTNENYVRPISEINEIVNLRHAVETASSVSTYDKLKNETNEDQTHLFNDIDKKVETNGSAYTSYSGECTHKDQHETNEVDDVSILDENEDVLLSIETRGEVNSRINENTCTSIQPTDYSNQNVSFKISRSEKSNKTIDVTDTDEIKTRSSENTSGNPESIVKSCTEYNGVDEVETIKNSYSSGKASHTNAESVKTHASTTIENTSKIDKSSYESKLEMGSATYIETTIKPSLKNEDDPQPYKNDVESKPILDILKSQTEIEYNLDTFENTSKIDVTLSNDNVPEIELQPIVDNDNELSDLSDRTDRSLKTITSDEFNTVSLSLQESDDNNDIEGISKSYSSTTSDKNSNKTVQNKDSNSLVPEVLADDTKTSGNKNNKSQEHDNDNESISNEVLVDCSEKKVDIKKRVAEILTDANVSSPRSDKCPRLQDLYVTAYDVADDDIKDGEGSPVKQIDDEVQQLLKKQLEIENEIKKIQQQQQKEQVPYMYVREIPNKPPPPYTPPVVTPTPTGSVLPSNEKHLASITTTTSSILYTAYTNKNLQNVQLTSEYKHQTSFEFVFDLCKEAAIEHYKQFEQEGGPSWMHFTKQTKLAIGKPFTEKELNSFLLKKMRQLLGYDSVKSAENFKHKWSSKKRDHVDELLVVECQEEEAEWVAYDKDEIDVKEELCKELMNMLISETAQIFSTILNKKTFLY